MWEDVHILGKGHKLLFAKENGLYGALSLPDLKEMYPPVLTDLNTDKDHLGFVMAKRIQGQ